MNSCFKHSVLTNLFWCYRWPSLHCPYRCNVTLFCHMVGMVWLETLIWCHFWHGNLHSKIQNQLSVCNICSKMKKNSPKEGQLAPCKVPSIPWLEAHINLIGPWELKSQGVAAKFWAVTIIDPITNLVEIAWVTSTKSVKNAHTVKNTWLSWYSKLDKVVTAASTKQHVSQHKKWFFGFSKLLKRFSNLLKVLSAAHMSSHILWTKCCSQSFSNSQHFQQFAKSICIKCACRITNDICLNCRCCW